MKTRSLLEDNRQMQRAIQLINLGARLQVLQAETELPYERLLKLYKEVAGRSPSKGQLPFSTDWFMTWQPNIHSSLFLNIYEFLIKSAEIDDVEAIVKSYKLYLEEIEMTGIEPILSVTRAWRLIKFVDAGMLSSTECTKCHGRFVTHAYELDKSYVCGLCQPPARAGKGRRRGAIH
ncbi:MAG: flagellar transcriptional regulator FlhC [Burkholderiaceae bacterium]